MRNPFEVGRTVRVACSALWLLETMYFVSLSSCLSHTLII